MLSTYESTEVLEFRPRLGRRSRLESIQLVFLVGLHMNARACEVTMENARIAARQLALEEKSAIYIYEKMCSCVVDASSRPCAPDPDFRFVFELLGGGGVLAPQWVLTSAQYFMV